MKLNQKIIFALWIKYFILTGWVLLKRKCLHLFKLLKQTRMNNNGTTRRKKKINYKTNIQKSFFDFQCLFPLHQRVKISKWHFKRKVNKVFKRDLQHVYLNLYNIVCEVYLREAGKKKKPIPNCICPKKNILVCYIHKYWTEKVLYVVKYSCDFFPRHLKNNIPL